MMHEDVNISSMEERDIDLIELGKKLWAKKIFILKISLIGAVVGVIIAFSIPREYATTVILAPESSSKTSLGGASALAAMAGINLNTSPTEDISPEIYPNIVESTPFIMGLSKIQVQEPDLEIKEPLFDYVDNHLSKPWWSYLFKLPRTIISALKPSKSETVKGGDSQFRLSESQLDVLEEIKDRIFIEVDKKTGIITLGAKMQSPEISAFVTDTLTSYLQSYIINYRTEKARADLAFSQKLYNEAKSDYAKAQQKYADYLDRNQNVILASYRVNQEKLQNEATLAYNVYNQVAQQLQVAQVKVQDLTPVYTVIQPAIIPLLPSAPNKKLILVGFVFLFAAGACGYILGKDYFKKLKS